MSEGGGSTGPDIGPNYQNPGPPSYSNPPSQPPTPSSTVQDPPNYQSNGDIAPENSTETKANLTNLHPNSNSGLPPFSSFAASDVNEGLGGRLAGDGYLTSDGISSTRVMELSGWDYCYTDGVGGRYIERGDSMPVMIPQPQYRPWESKQDGSSDSIKSTLPSFQSQFGEELVTTLTTLTPAACSPAPSVPSPGLPSFHTLSAVNPRYPLVPAPVQAREIPSIQQQFLDERHIHLFQGPPGQNFTLQPQNGLNGQTLTSLNNGTTLTTLNNAQYHPQIINNAQILPSGQILAPQSHILAPSSQIISSNGHIITSSGSQGLTVVSQNSTPTVLTVVKTEPVNIVELKSSSEPPNLTQLHHTNFQNPMITQGQQMDSKFGLESPPRVDGRKKERRKIRASSLESSNESDGAMSVESSGQVAAVSSTAGFKSPMTPGQMNNEDTGEKQTKKKRKRCGECIGCQRKDNCGDCAPCRNDKSHQICKMRRCEKLTEKKHLLAYNREDGGVSYRGRGRGRGRGSRGGYRGKGARPNSQSAQSSPAANEMNSTPGIIVGSNRENAKVETNRVNSNPAIPGNPALTPAMAVPFYATGTEVWSASTPADPWANQGQFIHQIDDIRYQHYPGYQTTGYQQTGFITDQTSAFQPQYTNATNGNPATSPAQGNVTPRTTGNYTQVNTPTPSPNPSTPHVNGHRNGMNVHYVEENYVNGTAFATDSSMAPPGSTTPNSRSSSVHMETNESNSKTSGYMSGNEIPGYPLNSPQCQSSCNSSGYPGQSVQSEYGDQQTTMSGNSYQSSNGQNQGTQKSPSYAQASPGAYHNYQNYNQQSSNHQNEDHQNSVKSSMSPGNCHPSQKSSGIYSQNSPKNFNSNPSPQNYQEVSPGQNRNGVSTGGTAVYENRSMSNGNMFQSDRFDQQNYPAASPNSQNYGQSSPNQEKSNVNARIKSMIMNKQQTTNQNQQQNVPNNNFSASSDNQMMSPHREIMSPSHQQQQQQNSQLMSQMMSPLSNQQLLSPNQHHHHHHHHHPHNQMMSPNGKDSKDYVDKIQQNDYGDKKREPLQMNENGNHHFLAFSHHLQDRSRLQPEGGGVQYWAGKFASGTNSQYAKISNYPGLTEPYTQGRKSKKKKDTCASLHAYNKYAPEDFQLEAYHTNCERNNNNNNNNNNSITNQFLSSSCVPTDFKPKNFYTLPDSIRTLETTFPTKRTQMPQDMLFNHSKSTMFGCHEFNEFNEHKFYQTNYNFPAQNSSNLNNNCFPKDKLKNFQVKGSCDHPTSFDYQNFQSFNGVNYDKRGNSKNLNFNEPEKGFESENYEKVSNKAGLGFENNEFCHAGYKQEKANEDVKLDLSLIDISLGQQLPTSKELSRSELNKEISTDEIKPEKIKEEEEEEEEDEEEEEKEMEENSPYPRISYAPRFKNMKIIDKRFDTCDTGSKTNWTNYQKDRENQNCESESARKENYLFQGEGGPIDLKESTGSWCCRLGGTDTPQEEHLKIGCCQGYRTADEFSPENQSKALVVNNDSSEDGSAVPISDSDGNSCDKVNPKTSESGPDFHKDFQENIDRLRNNLRADVPDCKCFPPDKCPPEPGSYYTHLGAAASLSDLRKELESRTGQTGKALRFEKICYTGKEGKTTQGCPLAKWVIRRSGLDEKVLIVVKHRQGHTCSTAWIVVCLVAWEGVPTAEADKVYTLLSHKLNKFGLPTTRRCATNEPRTCACQGLNPDTCGASFSFGCSWSMYYNGCKYARSKTVRKFRLSVRSEEQDVEERMHVLATLLSPLYSTLAPNAFHNQTLFEREASECRLGFKPGRPFSGVTACIDFCAHSHRDLHNMNNGCTVVVTLTKHRSLSKPDDEQLHVLPLYIMDDTDEFGCKEGQEEKCKNGSIECLNKFPCEVRVRAVPLQPCRRHGKKRKEEDVEIKSKDFCAKTLSPMGVNSRASPMQTAEMQSMMESQLQSSQVSSTVLDSPVGGYKQWSYSSRPECEGLVPDERWSGNHGWMETEFQRKQNWINSSQMPSHWEYPGQFVSDSDVNPDSTTSQTACKRNAVPGMASYAKYNASVPLHNASWNPVQQMNDKSMFTFRADDGKEDKFDGQSNSFPFRMPRGRPPSVHNFVSEQCETYIKPKETNESAFGFSPKIKQEFGIRGFERRNAWFENDLGATAAQTNSFIMNSNFNYCQTKNELNSRYSTECKETPNSSWPAFVDKDQSQSYFNGPVRWNDTPWDVYGSNEFYPGPGGPEVSRSEPIGEVTDFIENEECFKDSQMGGVAIALGHGSVLFECAKHELHATTALKKPNRLRPTRISLVFYQHRNLNRAKHGWEEWEEKMRLRKLGISSTGDKITGKEIGKPGEEPNNSDYMKLAGLEKPMGLGEKILLRSPTYTTTTWTTLFPMRPCMVTGPYQAEGDTEK